jgi:GR25 family glycosyltransferase involved in LPS biosynthesis
MIEANIISCGNIDNLSQKIIEYGMQPVLFKCINGKNIDPKVVSEYMHPVLKHFIPYSAIGCAISHMMLWEKLLASNDNIMLILEDDVIFAQKPDDFKHLLTKSLENVPENFDVLYLGCYGCKSEDNPVSKLYSSISNKRDHQVINEFIVKPKVIMAMHAYIISRRGAKKFLKHLKKKIFTHIDVNLQKISNENDVESYVSNPMLIYQTSTDGSESMNVNSHPLILGKLSSKIYLEDKLSLKYASTVKIFRIGMFNINIISIFFIILGVISSLKKFDLRKVTLFYLFLNIPDIIIFKSDPEFMITFTQNYVFLILPSIINYLFSR